MSINLEKLKAALKEAGHEVSEGVQWLEKDLRALYDFAHFKFGLTKTQVQNGMAYPSTLPTTFPGHPGADAEAIGAETPAVTTPSTTAQAAAAGAATLTGTVPEGGQVVDTTLEQGNAPQTQAVPVSTVAAVPPSADPATEVKAEPAEPAVDAAPPAPAKVEDPVVPPVSESEVETKPDTAEPPKDSDPTTANGQTAANNPVTEETKVPTTETPVTDVPTATQEQASTDEKAAELSKEADEAKKD